MKKLLVLTGAFLVFSCTPKLNDLATDIPVNASIDLVNVKNDKVKVEVNPGRFTEETINFYIPKTVPGTYSDNDYGQFIDSLTALDYNNNPLTVTKADVNTWTISNATKLDKVIYYVNDSFDTEQQTEDPVFSPAGTNIDAGNNFFLNMHMLVGYFDGLKQRPYQITFMKPQGFQAYTSMTKAETTNPDTDQFYANRYFEVTDNPVMYARPDSETFVINDIEVTLSVYSPSKVYSALSLKKEMQTMMQAQKSFLGDLNSTKKYNILLFLGKMDEFSPTGYGALEHHTSTTVVLPEAMPKEMMVQTMTDVVSHEFFHIVTPLSVHSEEVHYFDYNHPKMSKHLWMYEGVTEYFANLFQINQGLIDEQEFYDRMIGKIENSKRYDDNMSFTEMSQNILVDPYKDNYANVYEKGALIGMCIDMIIREQSGGEKGILWLMKELSAKYGEDKPFKDDELFDVITELTYPEVREFIDTYVIGDITIPYMDFFKKAGLEFSTVIESSNYLIMGEEIFIDANPDTKEIFVRDIKLNSFFNDLGIKGNDIIKAVNGTEYNLDNARQLFVQSMTWKDGDDIAVTVIRNGEEINLSGKISEATYESEKLHSTEDVTTEQLKLREAWLKG
ncbi:peptidase M61 [Robertkochia solimangrovi]|nr:peptidase M61 [Robertkochia solimangrovi]